MCNNILEYLEHSADRFPDKTAYADEVCAMTFSQVEETAKSVGSYLAQKGAYKEPILIYMAKAPAQLAVFFGTVYAGCFYVPIDEEMPVNRIKMILETTQARFMIYDKENEDKAGGLPFTGEAIDYGECLKAKENPEILQDIRLRSTDADLLYVLFTSGSTGIPKGVAGHHRGVIDYIEQLTGVLHIDENNIFGNQTPLFVDACMKEIYSTLKCGSSTYLIPKKYFMSPVKVVEYLNQYKINTICWVASALSMISAFGTFDVVKPKYLHTITFGSEVFPISQFNIWKKELPKARFFNLYGPTEGTGVCCWHEATHLYKEGETIPIGKAFKNAHVFLIKKKETKDAKDNVYVEAKEGEICIRGTGVTHGYYRNPEKTKEVFVQNPLHCDYLDLVYRTGDLARWNEQGELEFVSRKDYQIKHMGHRIELGEIEADAGMVEGVKSCCCVHIQKNNKILLYYTGDIEKAKLTRELKERLPRYMIPNKMIKLEQLPLLSNGKLDRLKMQEMYTERRTEE